MRRRAARAVLCGADDDMWCEWRCVPWAVLRVPDGVVWHGR